MAERESVLRRMAAVPNALVAVLLVMLLGVLVWTMRPDPAMKEVTAYFPRTVALYPGSEVKILGVPVGQVDTVTPDGDKVKVSMTYEASYDVPEAAKAVIVSPAIVGDRFVQLTPAYISGPRLADGAVLDLDRTAVPVELDTIYESIDELSVALGPRGANRGGALDNLVGAAADNLDGNGATLRQTLHDVGLLTGTLSDNKDELFDTVTQLDRFVGMLAANDTTIRGFNGDLAQVADVLADERGDLSTALDNLSTALGAVSGFVEENREVLTKNVHGLARVTDVLVRQKTALAQTLDTAPLALNNLYLAYNPTTGTLDQRSNIGENINQLVNDPALVLCAIVAQAGEPQSSCDAIKQLLATLAPIGQDVGYSKAEGLVDVEQVDPTLGGLFGDTP